MSLEIPYDDIDECGDWYQIVALTGMGIFEGTGQRTFRPDDTVTREQAAKIFVEVMAYCFGETSEVREPLAYRDAAAVSGWAREYVQLATQQGILQGSGENFRPQGQLTLEQAIVILERMYGNFVQEKAAA